MNLPANIHPILELTPDHYADASNLFFIPMNSSIQIPIKFYSNSNPNYS